MKKIPIDIMLHGQFIATLRMPLRPWPFTEDEVREFVLHPADASASVAVHRGRGERVRPE